MARTITIPGGHTAVLFDQQSELKPRRRREVEIVSSRLGRRLEQITKSARVYCEGDLITDSSEITNEDGTPKFSGDVDISEREMRMLGRLGDVVGWALLSSWSRPEPLPETPDDFLDIDAETFDLIKAEAAKINADWGNEGDPFTPDALPDDPTVEADPSLPTSA